MAKTSGSLAVADRVQHAEYGLGKIIALDDRYTTIDFDEAGVKKFVTELVRLTKSDAPAPAKPSRASRAKGAKAAKKS
ncbi:MAG TPA: hypothetical protein VFC25_13355 [Verrucomicrobiae bacterium]|jgi:hypothetical protein|nr:hypothetical protein [Candidatus Polarisedimenticolia bacterium]HYV20005.1 hypothetical protein [Verrucomicrobiae bacterium]